VVQNLDMESKLLMKVVEITQTNVTPFTKFRFRAKLVEMFHVALSKVDNEIKPKFGS